MLNRVQILEAITEQVGRSAASGGRFAVQIVRVRGLRERHGQSGDPRPSGVHLEPHAAGRLGLQVPNSNDTRT
jgi:hypothetical protein